MSKKAVKTVITFAVAVVIIIATIIPAVMIADTTSASVPTAEASETAVTTIVAPEHNPISKRTSYFITVAGVIGFAVTGALVVSGVRKVEDAIADRK